MNHPINQYPARSTALSMMISEVSYRVVVAVARRLQRPQG